MKQPMTPFATHLSGSRRETELRIRNIVRWKKKRPPISLMALPLAFAIGCGSLASCDRGIPIQYIGACESAPTEEFLADKVVVDSGSAYDCTDLEIHSEFEKENGNRILVTVENLRDTDENLKLRDVFEQTIPSGELRCVELELLESTDAVFYVQTLEGDDVDLSYSVVQYWSEPAQQEQKEVFP